MNFLMTLNVGVSLSLFNFFEKLCGEQFDLLCCWSMAIAFEPCVWRVEFELFSEKLFVVLVLVTVSGVIYEIIWFIELWFASRFASLIVSRSLELEVVFSVNETSASDPFRVALMVARGAWFEFWAAISGIVSGVSLFICALITALSSSGVLSISFVLALFALAFAIRVSSIAFSVVFIVLLPVALRWLAEEVFSLMIGIMILRLRDRGIGGSIELLMLWICWVIWSLKPRSVFWFFSLICDIRFNCQSVLTFLAGSADRVTSWRSSPEADELNRQSELTFLTDSADRITSWASVTWGSSEWLIDGIEIVIMRVVRVVEIVVVIVRLISSMFLDPESLDPWFIDNPFLSLLLPGGKSVFGGGGGRSLVDAEDRSE